MSDKTNKAPRIRGEKTILTDVHLRAYKNAKKPLTKAQGEIKGLAFCVSAKGHASWILRYYIDGVQKEITLGSYPEVSLKLAKEKAEEARKHVGASKDPALIKRAEALRRSEAETIADLCASYLENCATTHRPKTVEEKRRFVRYIEAGIGDWRAEDLEPKTIVGFIKRVSRDHTKGIAAKTLTEVRAVVSHAMGQGIIQTDPTLGLKAADITGKEPPRRVRVMLNFEELSALLYELPKDEHGLLLRLMLATGVRITEILEARWDEFDMNHDKVWYLPAERSKNGQPFTIPLTDACIAWLETLRVLSRGSELVFPKVVKKTASTVSRCRTGIRKHFVNMAQGRGVREFVPHDLRSTHRSWLGALGVNVAVAERCLNHTLGGLIAVYDKGDYLPERREALEKLNTVLDAAEFGRGWQHPSDKKLRLVS